MELVWPSSDYLPGYEAALNRGWSPDTIRGSAAAAEELVAISTDPAGFVASLVDKEAKGEPITQPDGSKVERLPGYHLWLWDGEFCGDIGLRWQPGTCELPPYCLGHIGFSVVPWKRRRGYATRALGLLLPLAAAEGLDYVDITTDADNDVSQKVILANGGVFIEAFTKLEQHGGNEGHLYRIVLA